jgi:hypothetical protein
MLEASLFGRNHHFVIRVDVSFQLMDGMNGNKKKAKKFHTFIIWGIVTFVSQESTAVIGGKWDAQ